MTRFHAIAAFLRLLMLWRNPIFVRYCRSQLRWKSLLGWSTVTLLLTGFVFSITYFLMLREDLVTSREAAGATILPLLVIQCLILMCKGSFSMATGITRESIEGILDYQRLTPLRPSQKILGYLFGIPVLDYVLFLLTVPFMAFAIFKAGLPGDVVLHVYSVFVSCVLLYHMTAFMAGMIVKKKFLVGFLSQLLMFGLYFILPLFSKLGYVFFEHLTIRPTVIAQLGGGGLLENFNLKYAPATVPFFNLQIPCHIFSLAIQLSVLALFASVVHRKWRNENHLLLDKHTTAVALAALFLTLIGTMVPLIDTGQIFPSWGPRYLLQLPPADFIGPEELILILGLFGTFSLVASLLALTVITPGRDLQIKGLRRMRKLGLRRIPLNDDAGSSLWHGLAICLITFLGWWLFINSLFHSRWYDGYQLGPLAWVGILLSLALPVVCYQTCLETHGKLGLFMALVIAWFVPLLAAILMASASDQLGNAATYIMALSGLALPFYSIEAGLHRGRFLWEFPRIAHAFYLVQAFYGIATAILILEWRKHRQQLRELIGP